MIRSFVDKLPEQPGVYRMLGADGAVLYVGKARRLRRRVASYTQPDRQSLRIRRMISLTRSMEVTHVASETEALLLEANLIKALRPRYNILFRDDTSFPYIRITREHDFPRIALHRGQRRRGMELYGPYASAAAVHRTLLTLQLAFRLRTCSDSEFANRSRPCLLHQIKRCSAPCVGEVGENDYQKALREARDFLGKGADEIERRLRREMDKASDELRFEDAARYRDSVRALTRVRSNQRINIGALTDTDVMVLHQDKDRMALQVAFYRAGMHNGDRTYFPSSNPDADPAEVLAAHLMQFYTANPVPKEVITNLVPKDAPLIVEALSDHSGHRVRITVPTRGRKQAALSLSLDNASRALLRRDQTSTAEDWLQRLAQLVGIEDELNRIEVFDNSHLQGTHAVGAMVVVSPQGFVKGQYRRYNMRDEHQGDDYGMMVEMLGRRFRAAAHPETKRSVVVPDLVILDGGRGQLSVVRAKLDEMGLSTLPLLAVAKGENRNAGEERLYLSSSSTPVVLDKRDPLLFFLQRMRDEAHRFVIAGHRRRRTMAVRQSPLDAIEGLGPKRKRTLLIHFGTLSELAKAGVEDLAALNGISRPLAERIYGFFHAGDS